MNYSLNKASSTVTFVDNFFVSAVLFKPEEEGLFELTYTNLFGIRKTLKQEKLDKEGRIIFWTYDCVKQISIKFNNEKIFAKKKSILEKFQLYGITFNDAINQLNSFYRITDDRTKYEETIAIKKVELTKKVEEITNKLNEYQDFLANQEEHESKLETDLYELKEQKKNLQNNINQQNADIESLNSQISAKENQLGKLENDFIELSKRSNLLSDGNTRLEDKQKELEKKVNLFPDTLEGFIQRASNTKLTYGVLAFIPLGILAFLINLSWDTLKGFTKTTTLTSFESAWIVLIQRIPFTLLVITLASMCIAFLYKMVRHLTEVQQQELNLAKISMLAKDVADSEYSHLDENALHKLRAEKKIKLIREFLNSEFNRYQQFVEKEETQKVNYSFLNSLPFKDAPILNKLLNSNDKQE